MCGPLAIGCGTAAGSGSPGNGLFHQANAFHGEKAAGSNAMATGIGNRAIGVERAASVSLAAQGCDSQKSAS
jgi:hypothetical protein